MQRSKVLTTLVTLTTLILGCSSPQKAIKNPISEKTVGQLDLNNQNNYTLSIKLNTELTDLVEIYGVERFGELLNSHVKEVLGDLYVPYLAEVFRQLRGEYVKEKKRIVEGDKDTRDSRFNYMISY